MALILIGEFAEDRPGDDIKLLTHNSKIIEDEALQQIILPTYLGLFSSGGNKIEEKYGTIPLENNRSSFAWAFNTIKSAKSRLLVVVVPTTEVNEVISKINSDNVSDRVQQVKSILVQENVNLEGLKRAISLLDSSLQSKDEVGRLSDVFGSEI